jgi:hypothetical protein
MWQKINAFNDWLGEKVTTGVGTMWCAYAFGVLALISFPEALASTQTLIQWIAQTFLQLVLLSVIIVGQNVQQRKHDAMLASQQALHDHLDTGHVVGELSPGNKTS